MIAISLITYACDIDRQVRLKHYDAVEGSWIGELSAGSVIFVFACVFLVLFSGIRYYVGTDYDPYINDYYSVLDGDFNNYHYETGYLIFMEAMAFLRLNATWFFSVVSAIVIIPIAFTIRKLSPYPIMSLTIFVITYFYFSSLNIQRQYMAMALVLWSLKFLFDKSFIRFAGLIALGSCFHSVAIVFLGLYFVRFIKINDYIKIALVVVATVVGVCGSGLATMILSIFPRYMYYLNFDKGSATTDILVQLLILLMLERTKSVLKSEEDIKKWNFYYISVCIAIILSLMSSVNTMFFRMGTYLFITCILSVPFCVYHLKKEGFYYYLGYTCLGVALTVHHLMGNIGGVVPYRCSSFFNYFLV